MLCLDSVEGCMRGLLTKEPKNAVRCLQESGGVDASVGHGHICKRLADW